MEKQNFIDQYNAGKISADQLDLMAGPVSYDARGRAQDNRQTVNGAIYSAIEPAIRAWFKAQCLDPSQRLYLYYREADPGETVAVPIIAADNPNPDRWHLASAEALRSDFTMDRARQWCRDTLQHCPILSKTYDFKV